MGAAIAELLVARGAHVVVTARHREDSEPPVRLIQADLASPEGNEAEAGAVGPGDLCSSACQPRQTVANYP